LVDPDFVADLGRDGSLGEAFRVLAPGSVQGHGAGVVDLAVGAVVDRGGGMPADPGVMVDVVVLGEESVAEDPGLGE